LHGYVLTSFFLLWCSFNGAQNTASSAAGSWFWNTSSSPTNLRLVGWQCCWTRWLWISPQR
jgi:hypothetical protein